VPAASSTGVPLLLDPRPRLIDRPREKVIGNLHALRRASSALWGGQESGPRGGPACNGTSRGWVKPRAGEREGAASRPVPLGAAPQRSGDGQHTGVRWSSGLSWRAL
jgi:hypothetical protein